LVGLQFLLPDGTAMPLTRINTRNMKTGCSCHCILVGLETYCEMVSLSTGSLKITMLSVGLEINYCHRKINANFYLHIFKNMYIPPDFTAKKLNYIQYFQRNVGFSQNIRTTTATKTLLKKFILIPNLNFIL
jgi:hypothetical protein